MSVQTADQTDRGPGRPSIGDVYQVRLPDDLVAWLDERAGGNRAGLIRDILAHVREVGWPPS